MSRSPVPIGKSRIALAGRTLLGVITGLAFGVMIWLLSLFAYNYVDERQPFLTTLCMVGGLLGALAAIRSGTWTLEWRPRRIVAGLLTGMIVGAAAGAITGQLRAPSLDPAIVHAAHGHDRLIMANRIAGMFIGGIVGLILGGFIGATRKQAGVHFANSGIGSR
jgi:hypothetical protein